MSASKDSVSVTADLFFYQNQLKGINPNRAGQKYWRRLSSVTRIKIVTGEPGKLLLPVERAMNR